ncbi:hypothetical protein Tco_0322202 [Tanacetum coccineum]
MPDIPIKASRLKEVMAKKGKKSSMKTFAPNDKTDYYSRITSITVNGKNTYELKGKFLDDLHNNAFLWNKWERRSADEIEVSDDESSDLEEYLSDKEETAKIFKIETDPTCSWREDGYCNGGNFPRAYHIGNSLHYQDLEWYEALEDSELKDEALRNKAMMEGLISDDESSNDCWKRWKSHEIYYHDYDEGEYENKTHKERHGLCGIETREVLVYQIKRYKMIKYSFKDKEEYVAVKEDEYNDLTITSEEACRAYQKIFWIMEEGGMVTRTE